MNENRCNKANVPKVVNIVGRLKTWVLIMFQTECTSPKYMLKKILPKPFKHLASKMLIYKHSKYRLIGLVTLLVPIVILHFQPHGSKTSKTMVLIKIYNQMAEIILLTHMMHRKNMGIKNLIHMLMHFGVGGNLIYIAHSKNSE